MIINQQNQLYLALMIGNSRLHWGSFCGENLQQTWNTSHLQKREDLDHILPSQLNTLFKQSLPLYIASANSIGWVEATKPNTIFFCILLNLLSAIMRSMALRDRLSYTALKKCNTPSL